MGYYLETMSFNGVIKKDNVGKLTEDFFNTFDVEKDSEGNVIDFWKDDLKLNFEDVIIENAEFIEPGSYIQMIGEDGAPFTWVIGSQFEFGYEEFDGESLFPHSELEQDFATSSNIIMERISDLEKNGTTEVSAEFDSSKKKYRITVEEIGKYKDDGTLIMRRGAK